MSGRWLKQNKAVFVRNLVRDYCKVCATLEGQLRRFDDDGTISYAVLRDLLGESIRKGVFWRLKDTAHHLFRDGNTPACGSAGESDDGMTTVWSYATNSRPDGLSHLHLVEALLDWCIGYAFHECVKLKEDAFLQQHYANRYTEMLRDRQDARILFAPLDSLTAQTKESIQRELQRIRHVLTHGRLLCIQYLANHGDNRHLARLICSEESLVRTVFKEAWPALIQTLYQGDMLRMYYLAARAYWEGGRAKEALAVLERAGRLHPLEGECLRLKEAVQKSPLPPDSN